MEKKHIRCIVALVAAVALAGCGTRPVVVATDDALVAAARSADKLQAIHDGLGSILQFHDTWIRESIAGAIAGIDRAFELLDEYDEFVQSLIARIRELHALLSAGEAEETGS